MAFHLVEEVPAKPGIFVSDVVVKSPYGDAKRQETSISTLALKVWRCGGCRALACGGAAADPPAKCAKCGAG